MGYREMEETLRNLELFCPDSECGDPVIATDGSVIYRKRRMTVTGFQQKAHSDHWRNAKDFKTQYISPVCGRVRKFVSRHSYETFKKK